LNRSEAGEVSTSRRRRRTRRHRRNRLARRTLLFLALISSGFGISSLALRYLSPSLFLRSGFHGSQLANAVSQPADLSRDLLLLTEQETLREREGRPVYPYSLVPGGVKDAAELKWAAEHDPVVRAHYAGFDYDHARVVRLVLARTAFISYRIGNKVYWTRRRITLKKGETVITDGRITARTRCGNRVEEVPQQLSSVLEPPAVKFDEPMAPALGTAQQSPPVLFQSALLTPPAGLGPPLEVFNPFGGGTWTPIFPPPLPGVCGVGKKHKGGGGGGGGKKGNPCTPGGGGGGQAPEPGTWILVGLGLAVMGWETRRRSARV
jgi:hypothetical protein